MHLWQIKVSKKTTATDIENHIPPRIYQESCDRSIDFLAKANDAYVVLEIKVLEEIAGITVEIEKENYFADDKELREFVAEIENVVDDLRPRVDQMNLEFSFDVRKDLESQM